MIADKRNKPSRPCNEYSIFFQLERAYIIQVLLNNKPSLDPSAIFHPSQASYAGLPPLPRRYASLILAYDWHLPGKEKRRKRKHRKSHGAIGFHDLSRRIVHAWKSVDNEVKTYCSQVCAAGMAAFKVAMKEWERNRGMQEESQHKDCAPVETKMASSKSLIQNPGKIKSTASEKKNPKYISNKSDSPKTLLRGEVYVQDTARDKDKATKPSPSLSGAGVGAATMEEKDPPRQNKFALDVKLVDMSNQEILDMWGAQEDPSTHRSGLKSGIDAISLRTKVAIQGRQEVNLIRGVSVVSNQSIDLDSKEISKERYTDLNDQHWHCYECAPVTCTANEAANHAGNDTKSHMHHSIFGSNGYGHTQTIRDTLRIKASVEVQMAPRSEKAKRQYEKA
eukprot:CAMPEP_0196133910 /NCGR_PEP_ID=MMETSP0910-20130528/2934_1 /TAXON_ID=49265 /ORGANISM="Thalassiosira rotula, Strain GSO102" /LENGTH=392 /DNA_ID=CAMNT_0041393673 /DNA_START=52 /DNA_END=1227 /DNA_ORIENTATION=-